MKFNSIRKSTDDSIVHDTNIMRLCRPYFLSDQDVQRFIRCSLRKNKTRWMFNRACWFTKLADQQKSDSVKIMFFMAMAEASVKFMEGRYKDMSNSSKDTKKFFESFSNNDKQSFELNFLKKARRDFYFRTKNIAFNQIIEILLNTRNRVAHGKNHYDFRFQDPAHSRHNLLHGETGSWERLRKVDFEMNLTYQNFRSIMLKNALLNVQKRLHNSLKLIVDPPAPKRLRAKSPKKSSTHHIS